MWWGADLLRVSLSSPQVVEGTLPLLSTVCTSYSIAVEGQPRPVGEGYPFLLNPLFHLSMPSRALVVDLMHTY